jgi:hypothetical protein
MLAHALEVGAHKHGISVTNLGAYMAEEPPTWEVELARGPGGEGTAWSCGHGLGRWQRDCGCGMVPPGNGWSHAWRAPLRAALDRLRDRAATFFEDAGSDLFTDVWSARDAYGQVIDAAPPARQRFLRLLAPTGKRRLRASSVRAEERALRLMELQRSALLMYASCGWFFDDVAGVESALVIRQAAFVLDQWRELGGRPPTPEFLDTLVEAKSNLPGAGTGADVYRRVARHRTTAAHAAAAVGFARLQQLTPPPGPPAKVPGFDVSVTGGRTGDLEAKGKATVAHRRTGAGGKLAWKATARARAPLGPVCKIGRETFSLQSLPDDLREPLVLALLARLKDAPHVDRRDARRALELAQASHADGEVTGSIYYPAFADLVPRLLERLPAATASDDDLAIVAAMLDAAPAATRPEARKRAAEWRWAGLATIAGKTRAPSLALRAVADKLGVDVDETLTDLRRRR